MEWLGFICNGISVACWLPCIWMFITRKQAKAADKMNITLFRYRTGQYELLLDNMNPVDPRIMRKYSHGVSRMGSDCLTNRQKFSYMWRARLGLNPYKSFTDTQMWMLGLKKPYFPKTFLTILIYERMRWKIVVTAPSGGSQWRARYRIEAGQLYN